MLSKPAFWLKVAIAVTTLTTLVKPAYSNPNPLGRVMQVDNSSTLQVGELFHPQDQQQLTPTDEVAILCYSTGQLATLSGHDPSQILSSCPLPQKCELDDSYTCYNPRPRSPEQAENRLSLLTPYPPRLLNQQPTFSWSAVPHATHYILRVRGTATKWEHRTEETTLAYPQTVPSLTPGDILPVIVTAYEGTTPLQQQKVTFQVISATEAEAVNALVNQVLSLNLPPAAVAQDLDSIYVHRGLFTQSITILNQIIQEGTPEAQVYRLLGDRYLQVGLVDQAEASYERARELAEEIRN